MSAINLHFYFFSKHEGNLREDGQMKVLRFCLDVGIIIHRQVCPLCEKEMKLTQKTV